MARQIPHERVGEILKTVLTEIQNAGGEARLGDIFPIIEPKLNLNEYELSQYESGFPRWRSLVHFGSIKCVKSGFIIKSGGRWKITSRGEDAIKKTDKDFFLEMKRGYQEWRDAQRQADEIGDEADEGDDENDKIARQTSYDEAVEQARREIENHITSLGPYDFQKLVGALLSSMGYHIRHIAPPGPDGGVDIVAYTDPLGSKAPRIIVQVKHRQNKKATAKEIRELDSLLRKEGDVGLFVSSSGFTTDAEREVRGASRHIDTMDLDRLISLWEENYEKIHEGGKALLPLVKLHFLAPTEE